jgi:hypothetical protein
MRRPLVVVTVLAATAAGAPSASAQPEAGIRVDRPTPIAAHGGRLAWSERVAGAERSFVLMTRAGGATARVPVAPRGVPYDVDLGPAPEGGVDAVYSRCRTEPPLPSETGSAYHEGRGCDVFRFSFATQREERVSSVSAPAGSEFWPTIHRARIAFGRTYDRKRAYPYLYVNDLGDERGSIRMPGGQRKACRSQNGRRVCTDDDRSAPAELELYGRRLAFTWRYVGFAEGFAYDLRLDDVLARDGDPRRIDRFGGGGLTGLRLGFPAFEAGRIYWTRTCYGDTAGCPGRRALSRSPYLGGTDEQRADPRVLVAAHERDAGTTWILRDTQPGTECRGDPDVPGGTCEVVALRPAYG